MNICVASHTGLYTESIKQNGSHRGCIASRFIFMLIFNSYLFYKKIVAKIRIKDQTMDLIRNDIRHVKMAMIVVGLVWEELFE